ncbi:hypothetical protein ABE444_05925 [Brevundimonas pondensis]|jgi:hypothetical protein|uniref:Secreted protein n=1 Tax=Brevundimonas pondensis TaxID=2774189 RepID=A0ABX7SMM0_9CAUL|nr:hypothetical protein [Brevundimonas pondensis]QTC88939.1 hypothetical protein IFE19_06270 [Brevundimonas pondensis]
MFATLVAIVALQTTAPAGTPEARTPPRPAATARTNSRRPDQQRPVCERRARTGSVLRRDICVTAQQAADQQSIAKQQIEQATAGVAHEELPLTDPN